MRLKMRLQQGKTCINGAVPLLLGPNPAFRLFLLAIRREILESDLGRKILGESGEAVLGLLK
jgi:hypothetical protein